MPSTALADDLFQDGDSNSNRAVYTWNSKAMRYQGAGGRFVSHAVVRDSVRQVIDGVGRELDDATLSLLAGRVSLVEWEHAMANTIRTVHAIGAATNAGGWGQLTLQDMAYVEGVIGQQLDLLARFATQIETGQQALTAQVLQRANMYKNAGETLQKKVGEFHAHDAGLDYYRNMLGPVEHCNGCLVAAAAGWVPIGTLVPIGERDCRTNCKCTWEYGNAGDVKPMDIATI